MTDDIPYQIKMNAPPTHCLGCGAEYEHIQHPTKPLGVSMMMVCKCVPMTTTSHGVTITVLVPPERAAEIQAERDKAKL